MALDVDFSLDEGLETLITEETVEDILSRVLFEERVDRDCMVSVSLVSNDRMRELNSEWRGVDSTTDVLSLECERPDDPDLPEGVPCELGDIVLAPDYIAEQATRLETPIGTECALLLVHGMLHLLGYDHVEEDEAVLMEAREDELVSLIIGTPTHATLTRHKEDEA